MARLFIDGFNTGDGSLWDLWSSGWQAFQANRPGFGSYCAYHGNSTAYCQKSIGTQTAIYLKFRIEFVNGSTTSYPFLVFRSGGTPIAKVMYNTTNWLPTFYTDNADASAGTSRAASATAFVAGRVYLVEVYYVPLNSGSGRFVLKVDGATWINWTGISTYGTENVDSVQMGNSASSTTWHYFGDFVVDDANWIGPSRVGYKQVSGAGNYAQFTPLAGANYTNVDELPMVSSDFNYVNANDQIDSFVTGALQVGTAGYSVNAIKAYQVSVRHRKTGSPTPTNMKSFVRSGTTDDAKGSYSAADAAAAGSAIWETDPATGQPWATDATPEIGYKSAA